MNPPEPVLMLDGSGIGARPGPAHAGAPGSPQRAAVRFKAGSREECAWSNRKTYSRAPRVGCLRTAEIVASRLIESAFVKSSEHHLVTGVEADHEDPLLRTGE